MVQIRTTRISETLRGKRRADDMPVVIKRYTPTPTRNISTLLSFSLGAWSVRHPCYAQPLDAFILRGDMKCETLVIVSEQKPSNLENLLLDRIKHQTIITGEEVVLWTKQILSCLVHLHTNWRVSHRNIKLSNVLLDEDMHVMLSDIAIPRNDPAG
ncbi:kinase-like domain-containing protein [Baffinella frigidus]|nr:kinase-like domain-containing protein [Cryptophyta sp. CCMP2293]